MPLHGGQILTCPKAGHIPRVKRIGRNNNFAELQLKNKVTSSWCGWQRFYGAVLECDWWRCGQRSSSCPMRSTQEEQVDQGSDQQQVRRTGWLAPALRGRAHWVLVAYSDVTDGQKLMCLVSFRLRSIFWISFETRSNGGFCPSCKNWLSCETCDYLDYKCSIHFQFGWTKDFVWRCEPDHNNEATQESAQLVFEIPEEHS